MKYAVVLNACSATYQNQAETLFSFISGNFADENAGQSVVIYSDEARKDYFIQKAPTTETHLVRVASYQPEIILDWLVDYFEEHAVDLILFPPDHAGVELSVRLAHRLNGSSIIGAEKVEYKGDRLVGSRSVYSNHLRGVFELQHKPYCVSLKKGIVEPCTVPDSIQHRVTEIDLSKKKAGFVESTGFFPEEKANQLESAAVVLAAGQGVGSKRAVEALTEVANQLGTEMAVSRPVAMNAWAPMKKMIGVSGVILNPELCVVLAASGAAAFMVGIEKSGFIIAINQDIQAPIVKQCDVAVIDDYQAVLEALMKIIQSFNNNPQNR
jgi:electron transfer flavoprotein alpha subunit